MSTLKVNKLRDTAGSADAITLDPNGGAVLAGVTTVSTVKVGSGVTISSDGDVFTTGITTSSTVIVGSGVTISESGIEASGIGITCANINGTQIGGRRNIIINGAMLVAQRGTSSNSSGYQTVDRYKTVYSGLDNAPTFEQVDTSSSDTPYTLGLRKAFKVTNGDQTSVGTADNFRIEYKIEAQNIGQSGWNFKSSTSFITLSFWCKSSVAQNFAIRLYNADATYAYSFVFAATTSWTKITHSIKGDSGIVINNDNGGGLNVNWVLFEGTDGTTSGHTNETWASYSTTDKVGDMTSTWYDTNDATFELTGVQLEVGSQATPFEHRSFGEELALCQRYYQRLTCVEAGQRYAMGHQTHSGTAQILIPLVTTMRTRPTALETSGTATDYAVARTSTWEVCNAVPTFYIANPESVTITTTQTQASLSTGIAVQLRANATGFFLGFSAEL